VNRRDRHLPVLDYFRGTAILAVLIAHFLSGICLRASTAVDSSHHPLFQAILFGLYAIFILGTYGVAIFFVVSGFCIHLSYRRSSDSGWFIFYVRRVFRLYPAYLFALFLCIVVLPSSRWSADALTSTEKQIDLFLHLFLIHNLRPHSFSSIAGPFWSLAIEFQLYLLFPLLLGLVRRIGWRQMLMVTAVIEVVTRASLMIVGHYGTDIAPSSWWGWTRLSPTGFWFSWALGAMLAEAVVEQKTLPFAKGPLPLWLWPLIVLAFHHTPYLENFAFPVAAFATVRFMSYFLSRDPDRQMNASDLPLRFLTFFGLISYSIYLLHIPLFFYFRSCLPKPPGFVSESANVIVFTVAIIAASYLVFRFVETPGIKMGKRLIDWFRLHRKALNSA